MSLGSCISNKCTTTAYLFIVKRIIINQPALFLKLFVMVNHVINMTTVIKSMRK